MAGYPGFSLPPNWAAPSDPLSSFRANGGTGAMPTPEEQAKALLPMLIMKYLTPKSGESTYNGHLIGPSEEMPSQYDLGAGLSLLQMMDKLASNKPDEQLKLAQAKYYGAEAEKASRGVFDNPDALLTYLGNEDQKDEALLEKYRSSVGADPEAVAKAEEYFAQRRARRDEARRLAASGDTRAAWKVYGQQDMTPPAPQGGATWAKYKDLIRSH